MQGPMQIPTPPANVMIRSSQNAFMTPYETGYFHAVRGYANASEDTRHVYHSNADYKIGYELGKYDKENYRPTTVPDLPPIRL